MNRTTDRNRNHCQPARPGYFIQSTDDQWIQQALGAAIDAGNLPQCSGRSIGFQFVSDGAGLRFVRRIDSPKIQWLFGMAARKGYLAQIAGTSVGFRCLDGGDAVYRVIKNDNDQFIMRLLSQAINNGYLPERQGDIIGFPCTEGGNVIHISEKIHDQFIKRLFSVAFNSGYLLDRDSTILDFGCGSGADVYRFRDLGFNAYGFDIHDYLELRSDDDRAFFTIMRTGGATISDFRVDWDSFSLPYADNSFDFVFSNQVLEHVQNHDRVFSELARVMKPVSLAIHIFPPKYIFKEPHIYVPMGSWINNRCFYRFWAWLGIRNEYQKGKDAREVAEENYRYSQQGLNYLSPREILALGRRHFSRAMFVPDLWEQDGPYPQKWKSLLYHRYYTYFKNTVLRVENTPPESTEQSTTEET